MIVKYKIDDKVKDEVSLLLKQERNLVVKERLTMVSMYINGILKKDIVKITGKSKDTVGRWITAYFNGGIKALQDNRGGANNSYLSNEQKQEIKNIITQTYPISHKGWDGWLIVDLIRTKYGVTYTRAGVYALMKSLGITHKIASKIDPKKSEEKIDTWKESIKKTT